ncbi:MAG TPA: bifunctional diaminohydroxyphosphoribosylaminopyrimidine deaminase/5-amino-6-(5-phosphoribosylamino)uracil reductase RibD [Erythrobacter sp.]|nr:bifunctional diaminohydroxyphosphoribosylaminopyrimidine deaminase/5-amino-6-(5-phosphoribosylamino)uracil reductase RibD [Erythrobacter sp.]
MTANKEDARWLAAAARLGSRGQPLTRPNPAVGAIIVKDDKVVGRGWTQAGGRPHAEAMALENAGKDASGATVYVSLEPCAHESKRGPSCASLLAKAKPARVIAGLRDPDPRTSGAGIQSLREAGVKAEVLECEASRQSLCGYLAHKQFGRPYVTLKLAFSADGRISTGDSKNQWITGEAARAHVHAQRARQDAILVGGGTWREDQPGLDVRLPELETRSPARWVLSRGEAPDGVSTIPSPSAISEMKDVQYLYVEGGAQAAAAFLKADLVDRIDIYHAPVEIGAGENVEKELGLDQLAGDKSNWEMIDECQLGIDRFAAYQRCRD